MKLGIDPKQFKHVHTDDKSTTLQHKNGHVLTVAHNVLSPKMQAQLKALASDQKSNKPMQEEYAKGGKLPQRAMPNNFADMPPMAEGGDVNRMNKAAASSMGQISGGLSEGMCEGGKPHYDDGGIIDSVTAAIAPMFHQADLDQRNRDIRQTQPIFPPDIKTQQKADGGIVKEIHSDEKEPGYTTKMAEGGLTPGGTPAEYGLPCLNPNCKSHGRPHPNCRCYGFADGGEIIHYCRHGKPHKEDCAYYQGDNVKKMKDGGDPGDLDITDPANQVIEPTGNTEADRAADEQTQTAALRKQLNPGEPENQAPQDDTPSPQSTDTTPPAANAQPTASTLPPDQTQPASAPAPVPEQASITPPKANSELDPQTYRASLNNDLLQMGDEFHKDLMNGHVQPETYRDLYNKKETTLGKVGMLFGMLASGLGSGLAHQPNMLMEMMNNEIKNDYNAQVQSKTNAQNFYTLSQAHQAQQADIQNKIATGQLTKAQATLALKESDIKSLAAGQMRANIAGFHDQVLNTQKLPEGSPQRQNAENALALLYPSLTAENSNIADRAAAAATLAKFGTTGRTGSEAQFQAQNRMMRMSGDPRMIAQADKNERTHSPYFPGQQASRELHDNDHNYLESNKRFQTELNNFIDWTKTHSGDINPSDRKYGQALAANLQGAYRTATQGGVYKEGEQNFISKIIDDTPTKFFNEVRVLPSLNAISKDNTDRFNNYAKNLGFTPQTQGETRTINGAQYQKVQGGWQRIK